MTSPMVARWAYCQRAHQLIVQPLKPPLRLLPWPLRLLGPLTVGHSLLDVGMFMPRLGLLDPLRAYTF